MRRLDPAGLLWGQSLLCALLTAFALSVQIALPGSYGDLALPDRVNQLIQGGSIIYLVAYLALVCYYRRLLPLARLLLPSRGAQLSAAS